MEFRKKDAEKNPNFDSIISSFRDLSKEEKIDIVSGFVEELKSLHGVSESEILGKKESAIPIGVFSNDALSCLEAIVKYMKEDLKMRFSKIAKLLNRSSKTIWATYSKSIKKMPSSFFGVSHNIMIPASAISNRSYSTLESVVGFVKDLDYSNHEVAEMLHLDDRTIWTIWDRVKKKRGMKTE